MHRIVIQFASAAFLFPLPGNQAAEFRDDASPSLGPDKKLNIPNIVIS
jgi:hypothetical protein